MNTYAVADRLLTVKDNKPCIVVAIERILPNKTKRQGKHGHTQATNFELVYTVRFEDDSEKKLFSFQLKHNLKVI